MTSLVKAVALGSLQVAPYNKENSCAESPSARRAASESPLPSSKVLTPSGQSPCRRAFAMRAGVAADWQAGLEAALAIQALHAGRGLGA